MTNFGDRFRRARIKKGLTLKQIAEHMNVSSPSVWAWEHDRAIPRAQRLAQLEALLGTSLKEDSLTECAFKRYLIFGGARFYARGGGLDLVTSTDTEDEAITIVHNLHEKHRDDYDEFAWWHILDLTSGTIVAHSDRTAMGSASKDFHTFKDEPDDIDA